MHRRAWLTSSLLALALLCAAPAHAALAFVQRVGTTSEGSASTCTLTINGVTSGNLLVMTWLFQGAITSVSVADGTNTYTNSGSTIYAPASNRLGISYAKNVTGGNLTVTATANNSSGFTTCSVSEFSGADTTSPYVTDSTGTGSGASGGTGTLTLTGNSVIVCMWNEGYPPVADTAPSGYTRNTEDPTYLRDGYHITSSSEACTPTYSPNATGYQAIAAAFAAASAGGSPTWKCNSGLLLLGAGCGG